MTGDLLIRDVKSYTPSEFRRYQEEWGQDKNSRIARPLFIDEAGGDYRQRSDSPSLDMGIQNNIMRKLQGNELPSSAMKIK